MIKDKLKAASIHLAISAFILAAFLLIVFSIWYPAPFADISGLNNLLAVLIGVDLILGPLLTFIIFKRNKSTLKFDLSVIASIQLVALIYGSFTIYQGHPAYVVYAIDRFELISAKEALPERAQHEEFKISKLSTPKLAYAKRPEDSDTRNKLLFEVLSGLPDLERRPEYYEPFDQFAGEVLKQGLTPQQFSSNPENQQKLSAFLEKYGKSAADYAYLPLIGKEKDVLWVWDRTNAKPVGTLDISPWQLPKVAANR
ncbi:TfpX/TfpZ family type IV pilin accessory protein [Thiothrix subterranea]|uniref:TfpX/TfpZ family type IV pilin accessory protein n=1 Tax=Thiothrix subterranea TaxID=2735563 RepID=A0AA51R641_9GAMM|nr:TfpX/TfpZ family type IV pilin accessory protein [Thiothrix subterranea]MDQ5769711.1 TfpX/TfpZ family type IV pilin accessory protein [Thiothrix subterranea]WML88505.1 TfpX/TfpZ family type IV pilin accessory protein [Thiothrix subterranea]